MMRVIACVLVAAALAGAGAEARPPAAWVTVTGQVVLPPGVPVPGPKFLPGLAAPDETVLVNDKTRGVKNVVVWLRPDDKNPKSKLAADEIHPADAKRPPLAVFVTFLPQQTFSPRVVTARPGDTLVVRNLSPGATNFFWASLNNGNVNVVLAPGGAFQFPAPLVAETVPVTFKSNVIPTGGVARVFEHPYHAVTDADGKFTLKDAPAGKYRLVYWHERIGFKDGKDGRFGDAVEIKPGARALPPVEFDVTK